MDVSKPIKIVVVGKTGAGKSSLANTIFGEVVFPVAHSITSETRKCQAETKSVNRRNITLIDTPGFFDTNRSEEEMKPEIVRCITECAPGPHAFLIVLKVEKCTDHTKAVITKIYDYFSDEVLKYATVVFTHGDQLPKGQTIKDFISQSEFMTHLVQKCNDRYHVIDNEYWKNTKDKYRNNLIQVEEILKTIDKTVQTYNGGCYTNEMLQAVEAEIYQEEEQVKQSSGNKSKEEIRRQARDNVFKKLLIKLAGTATGALLGAFLGVAVMVGGVMKLLQSSSESVQLRDTVAKTAAVLGAGALGAVGGTAAGGSAALGGTALTTITVAAAAAGAVKGGVIGYNAAEGADSPLEAANRAAEAVKNQAQSYLDKTNDAVDKLFQSKSKQNQNPK